MTPLQASKLRHIYLTWQRDPCRTITVNIHGLKTPQALTVYYDNEPHFSKINAYPNKVTAEGRVMRQLPDGRQIYHIELTNLTPGATYYFTIGDNKRALGNELCFQTIPNDDRPLLFVEGGDWENTPNAEALAKKAASLNPLAVWLGGDYPSNVNGPRDFDKWDYWLDVYSRTMVTPEGCLIPMVMAIGNHEVIGGFNQQKELSPFFFQYFKQGNSEKSYFSLSFGEYVRLLVLDSGHTALHDGDQKTWLIEELKSSQNIPITIAVYHVPLFPSIRFAEKDLVYRTLYGFVKLYKNQRAADRLFSPASFEGKKHWLPLFDHYGLTAAFEHHDQTLKRTKLLRHGHRDSHGTLYLGDGGWGPKVQFPPLQGWFRNYFASLQGKEHFFWAVEIEKTKITYRAITSSGKVIDRFTQRLD